MLKGWEKAMDVIIVGAGLAGLVTATELLERGKRVLLLDQEGPQSLGGQAHWSFGGLFLVNTPEQRRMGIRDTFERAWKDWSLAAGFDRLDGEDFFGEQWAKAYVSFATHEKYAYLKSKGIRFFPVVGWAERGAILKGGYGNSVPRFHITWGTGPGIVAPFKEAVLRAQKTGQLTYLPRHEVTALMMKEGRVTGVSGNVLEEDSAARGEATNRMVKQSFQLKAEAVVIASGGIGANLQLVKENWPARLGKPPEQMLAGVPSYVDGKLLQIAEGQGAKIVNKDRMWHYTEGIRNYAPVWYEHGIRILPGPSSIWLDGAGKKLPHPNYPGFDTLTSLEAIQQTGFDYSWFILTEQVIAKEFALSGSEQNPDLTDKSIRLLMQRLRKGAPAPVQRFVDEGEDFLVATSVKELAAKMNALTQTEHIDFLTLKTVLQQHDATILNKKSEDAQVSSIYKARRYVSEKLIRVAKPHAFLSPASGKLIAVRLRILTRKTLGGIQTNLKGQVIEQDGSVLEGLYAVGEAAGFGGGGVHGYRALEGTFLGGCIFTGYTVGRAIP